MRRLLSGLALLTVPALLLGSTTAGADAAPAHADAKPLPRSLALPKGFQPEGIAVDGRRILVSSKLTGDVYAIDAKSGKGHRFATGPGTPSLGLKVDEKRNRLFVAGGTGGDARVLNLHTGKVVRSYRLTTQTSFVNDAVITKHAVWFTDSAQAQLYKLPLGPHGELPKQGAVKTVPLTGQWQQATDATNANGITATPDGTALLVVNSTSGKLYRVTHRGVATRVRVGASLQYGDGMLLQGRNLLVVRNQANEIAVAGLNRRGTHGHLEATVTDKHFDVPSTVAARGDDVYLPNARFTTTPTPTTHSSVTRVPLL